ncbi:hypothetical protein AB6919_000349 [Vibrio cholerae]|nr:hypothetical protein [Vibrio cholerae]EJL6485839.1 hypothetical protein [Vibrio cholerae]EJL6584563.1 hypothetical protein [Vibrio cholerae]EJL6888368.1 hypothetical protein [Vibrio cholerae]EKF9424080.1 hypothetical protein [Vibrio cholerae]
MESTLDAVRYPLMPYAALMVKSNAQRQAKYQRRQQEAGSYRLDAYISADARDALEQVIEREGCTRKEAIERSIFNEAKGRDMQSHFRTDDPATDPVSKPRTANPVSQPATTTRKDVSPMTTTNPARPSQMTAAEAFELDRFKQSLPNAIVASELDQKAHAFNGGDSGARRKAAFEAQLNATNQHRK